jgi:isochorismatase family protein
VCGVAPALHARRDGYQVTFAANAAGSLTEFGHDISLRRMEHKGITVATTATVIAELARDYPAYSKIMCG